MITIKDWMELINYRITEGDTYGWACYGPNSYQLSSWNGIHGKGGWSANIVFSTKSQKVYEVAICDYTNDRAYRVINPKFVGKHRKESMERGEWCNQAWDDVDYTDLEVKDDFMEKAMAIIGGQDYDTRIKVPIDFNDDELLAMMKLAHEKDITLNQLVEEALVQVIDKVKEKQVL